MEISAELSIAPNDSLESIAKLKLGEVQQLRDMETGYKWLTLKNVVVKDEYFILALCFFNDILKSVNVLVDDKPFNLNSSWEDCNEAEEEKTLLKYKQWIAQELGREGRFSWGEVSTNFDRKGWSTSIIVRYT